ncbi:hypothetical protein CDN99_23040 [Roseateles aquatilis]|uniref:DUF4337 domain-containing protein n=1 Tax=Roseateles aquatilis TaxID=431061 RepID=A0A246IY30_9BURK|nr:DUF4337 domain-containing protein [Roseateles aquatilis]OWQ85090.1 hypothetical protein CDN99_23040 [Roseateles aquatilis]
MDIDPEELIESARQVHDLPESAPPSQTRLNVAVALTVALLATFMGICKIKDDNIGQAMQQAQADKLDHWSFYQARNAREEVARATLTQLELQALGAPASAAEGYQQAIARYKALAEEQGRKKDELRRAAEEDQRRYDALNYRDDQFDLSDALLAIAIAMLAVTALTQMWWLYAAAMVPTVLGVVMGLAGLGGWPLHPDMVVKLLS